MRIFVYEYISGGGLLVAGLDEPIPESLVREGRAMLSAVTADFCVIAGVEVIAMRDGRQGVWGKESGVRGCVNVRVVQSAEEELAAFDELTRAADATLVIAPELGGALLTRCRRVEELGGRLLGPSSAIVELASDKHRTAEWLAGANVPAPIGCAIHLGQRLPTDFPYPAVIKPRDGAGSQDVRFLNQPPSTDEKATVGFAARLERFCPGTPASVAVLCGPRQRIPLPPCRQRLSADGTFRYLGGSCPLEHELATRAQSLAMSAVATLPAPQGYLGVDLVLGERPNGRDDVAIEINPRLTTSYVGLRQLAEQNLAETMLAILNGRYTSLSFTSGGVQFEADGKVNKLS